MAVFIDILKILSASSGGIAYHLVVLFCIWILTGLALSRWIRGERRGIVAQMLVAGGLMSLGHLACFVIALLDQQKGNVLVLLGPPLERLVDAMSLLLICWAFTSSPRQRTISRILFVTAAFLFLGFYVIAAMQWSAAWQDDHSLAYNLFWQPWAWEIGQFLCAAFILAYLFAVPIPERGTLIAALGVMAVGHLLQLILPFASDILHIAGWVRLASLTAFPLLSVAAFRLIIQRFDTQVNELQVVSQESLAQVTGLMDLVDINQKLVSSLDAETVLKNTVLSISQIIPTNLCALAFVVQENIHELELAIVYDEHQIRDLHTRFPAEDYSAVEYAITRNKPVILELGENGQTANIYRLIGNSNKGPLIIQPLEQNSTVMGVILVGRPGQTRPFTAVEIHKCETLAHSIALAINNSRQYHALENRNEQATADLRLMEMEQSRTRAGLENRLKQSQKELSLYIQKLYETEISEQRMNNDVRDIRAELNRLKSQEQHEADQARSELEQSLKQISLLTRQIGEADATRIEIERRNQALEQHKIDLQTQLTVVKKNRDDLETQIAQLQKLMTERGVRSTPGQLALQSIEEVALENIACGVIICDRQGRIIHLNEATRRIVGESADRWLGKIAFDLWPDSTWQGALHVMTDQYNGNPGIGPFTVAHASGRIRIVLAPLHVNERHIGTVVTLDNVENIDEKIHAKDEFMGSLSQELRTPMTSIVGYTELLLSGAVGELDGTSRKFLQRVQANIERMGGMLNDLIGITAIDSGKLILEMEMVSLKHLIENALNRAQFRLEEKELQAHLDIVDLPATQADPESLQQILDNLLSNACKSSQIGTIIHIKARQETNDAGQSFLHVSISDTGGGVALQDRARVFERFYRADDALIAGLGETGVGLSIVKSLIEAHNGQVWIESNMGSGSIFHFTIPLKTEKQSELEPPVRGNGHG